MSDYPCYIVQPIQPAEAPTDRSRQARLRELQEILLCIEPLLPNGIYRDLVDIVLSL
jgi:hypothetical protein